MSQPPKTTGQHTSQPTRQPTDPTTLTFAVRGEFIPLDALLKATGLAPSGGIAKAMVADGLVRVDGEVELRKTCKLRPGQRVRLATTDVCLVSADEAMGSSDRSDDSVVSPYDDGQ